MAALQGIRRYTWGPSYGPCAPAQHRAPNSMVCWHTTQPLWWCTCKPGQCACGTGLHPYASLRDCRAHSLALQDKQAVARDHEHCRGHQWKTCDASRLWVPFMAPCQEPLQQQIRGAVTSRSWSTMSGGVSHAQAGASRDALSQSWR